MGLSSLAVGLVFLIYHLASESDLLKLKIAAGILCVMAFLNLFLSPLFGLGTFVLLTFLCGYILMIVGYALTLKKLEEEYPDAAKPEKPAEEKKPEAEVSAGIAPEKSEIIEKEKPAIPDKEKGLDLAAYDIPDLKLKEKGLIPLGEKVEKILDEKVDGKLGLVDEFCAKFGISNYHARLLRDADYGKVEDLEDAIIEDLIMIEGINPTVARKIVSYFKKDSFEF